MISSKTGVSSFSSVDCSTTSSLSVVYNLKANKSGKYKIGSATAKINGKILKTKPFSIEVVKKKNLPPGTAAAGEEFFVRVEPSTTIARIGQQITVDYKLYTKVNIESYDMGADPNYNGFFAQDIRRFSYRTMQEEINGENGKHIFRKKYSICTL